MSEVSVALKRKLGPLPAWAWLAVVAAGLFAVRRLNLFGSGGSSRTAGTQSSDVGPLPSFGPYGYTGAPNLDSGTGSGGDPFTPVDQTPIDSSLTSPGTPVVYDPLTGTAQDTSPAPVRTRTTQNTAPAPVQAPAPGAPAAPGGAAPAPVQAPAPAAPAPPPENVMKPRPSVPVPAPVYATIAPPALAQTPLIPRTTGDPSDAAIDFAHGAGPTRTEVIPPPPARRPASTHGQTSQPRKATPRRSPAQLRAVKQAEARAIKDAGARKVAPNVHRPGIQL